MSYPTIDSVARARRMKKRSGWKLTLLVLLGPPMVIGLVQGIRGSASPQPAIKAAAEVRPDEQAQPQAPAPASASSGTGSDLEKRINALEPMRAASEAALASVLPEGSGRPKVRDVYLMVQEVDGQPVGAYCGSVRVKYPDQSEPSDHSFVAMPTSVMVEGVNASPTEMRKVEKGLCEGGQLVPTHWGE